MDKWMDNFRAAAAAAPDVSAASSGGCQDGPSGETLSRSVRTLYSYIERCLLWGWVGLSDAADDLEFDPPL
jgi:hypothetical protein